jgi:hypothetical protein
MKGPIVFNCIFNESKKSYIMHKLLSGIKLSVLLTLINFTLAAQNTNLKQDRNAAGYCGIEIGSKGVKMSIIETGKKTQSTGAYHIIIDSSSNSEFISYTAPRFSATLTSLCGLYNNALKDYAISSNRNFTVIS